MRARTKRKPKGLPSVADLSQGEEGTLDRIDLPEEVAHRLMELGFLPGCRIVGSHRAPGGGPRVYRVDGSEVALRRETAAHLILRTGAPSNPRDAV
jgi:ferrous iron transport protein A